MAQAIDIIFRDYDVQGVPASGPHNPIKSEIRDTLGEMEAAVASFLATGRWIYSTVALMNADLAHAANEMAWVIADTTVANNGIYQKQGASGTGSWTRKAELPFTFVKATDAGAGTPTAIVATSPIPIPENTLVLFNLADPVPSVPVTVAFNGGAALTIKAASGADPVPSALIAGLALLGVRQGSTFRLFTEPGVTLGMVANLQAQIGQLSADLLSLRQQLNL